jgi:LmbE family N-acetylglucosaminyl deacetylase
MTKFKKYLFLGVIAVIFLLRGFVFSAETSEIPAFTKDDRVLVFSPHPDDETIACAGIIQRALSSGAKVLVACYTNGENNELAFIVYEKRLTFKKAEFLHMGQVRRKETQAAMVYLGVESEAVKTMGYPDFGTLEILTKYWGKTNPCRSMFARLTKVSYPDALSVGAPYVGESILRDLKTILSAFKPTRIFVSHPADTNRDHQSLYLFLYAALWDLEGKINPAQVHPYLVHVVGWPKPRGYHPDLEWLPPDELADALWNRLTLRPEEIAKKQKSVSLFKSQNESNPPYLFTFVRKNELFSDCPLINLKKSPKDKIEWQDAGAKAKAPLLSYACQGNNLLLKLGLKRKFDKNAGVYIYLLGYSKKEDFAKMPKLAIQIGILGMRIKDKKEVVFLRDAKLSFEGRNLVVKIPLTGLGNPDYIFARTRRRLFRLPLDVGSWRIIKSE